MFYTISSKVRPWWCQLWFVLHHGIWKRSRSLSNSPEDLETTLTTAIYPRKPTDTFIWPAHPTCFIQHKSRICLNWYKSTVRLSFTNKSSHVQCDKLCTFFCTNLLNAISLMDGQRQQDPTLQDSLVAYVKALSRSAYAHKNSKDSKYLSLIKTVGI